MKMETSRRVPADALTTLGGLGCIFCSLFLLPAVVAALGGIASARTNDGLAGATNPLPATLIVVTNTNDSGPGSLRNALAIANDGDTVDATGVSGTILLTRGELQITHNVTINGPGADNLSVHAKGSRVFENFASDVNISGITITNGFGCDSGGGGGILNHGGLTLSGTSILNNSSGLKLPCNLNGGGIATDGRQLTVMNSTISGNSAGCAGGGIYAFNGQLTVMNSTISGNGCQGVSPPCEMGQGGGMFIGGGSTATVTNSTFSDNFAQRGGSIFNEGAAQLGDTILNAAEGSGTILNGGRVTSRGYNLASDNGGGVLTGPGDQINTGPMLDQPQDVCRPGRPPATPITNPATNVTSSSATLNGTAAPLGCSITVHFQYGRTTSYGSVTPNQTKTGFFAQNVTAKIGGLTARTTYHFRIVATNRAGTRYGIDRTFTTH